VPLRELRLWWDVGWSGCAWRRPYLEGSQEGGLGSGSRQGFWRSQIRSAARKRADRLRGLAATSSAEGRAGFRVNTRREAR